MAPHTLMSLLLLVSVSVAVDMDIPEHKSDPEGVRDTSSVSTVSHMMNTMEVQLLTVERVLRTLMSTSVHTVKVYPTCTTTVKGVSACHHPDDAPRPGISFLNQGTTPIHTLTHTKAPEMVEGQSSSFSMEEVVMPSCDCSGEEGGESRSPRLLRDNVITIKSTTTMTVNNVVTSTDQSTTVSITYNGCVPDDALTTTTCHD